jgi:hypothetical protein
MVLAILDGADGGKLTNRRLQDTGEVRFLLTDSRSDIFSLGTVLFEISLGLRPGDNLCAFPKLRQTPVEKGIRDA